MIRLSSEKRVNYTWEPKDFAQRHQSRKTFGLETQSVWLLCSRLICREAWNSEISSPLSLEKPQPPPRPRLLLRYSPSFYNLKYPKGNIHLFNFWMRILKIRYHFPVLPIKARVARKFRCFFHDFPGWDRRWHSARVGLADGEHQGQVAWWREDWAKSESCRRRRWIFHRWRGS